jgi:ABC-type bacteriocin/lantibiotic exporter with double-glycine peptidase domain
LTSSLYQNVKKILHIDRGTFFVLMIYSLTISLLTLAVPIAAQTLVNLVSFGTLVRPIFILTFLLFILLTIAAVIQITRSIVVENLQQSIFANITLKFAMQLNNIKLTSYKDYRGPELVNRFFEVVTVQKTTGIIFLTIIDLLLQAIFSMIVLAFYHPILLAFDIALIITMFLVVILPYRGALRSAIIESDEKHEVAAWLDEVAQNPLTFRMNKNDEYAINKTDSKLLGYITNRQLHFRNLLKHRIGVLFTYVAGNTVLLGLGGYLVINGQLSLGQLIAAELLVNIILSGFIKLGSYFRDYYDLLAGVIKLSKVFNLPTDLKKDYHPIDFKLLDDLKSFHSLSVENFSEYNQNEKNNEISFSITKNQRVLITDRSIGRIKHLMDQLFSFNLQKYNGKIYINGSDLTMYDANKIRKYFSIVRGLEIFTGTIMDNMCLDRDNIDANDFKKLIDLFNLTSFIHNLPDGYNTEISGQSFIFNLAFLQKISIIRAILLRPNFLILENSLDIIPENEIGNIISAIDIYTPTAIISTQRNIFHSHFNHIIEL